MTTRIGVLVSGSGTNLQALLDTIADDPTFGGEVVVVGSDREGAAGLDRARAAGVPAYAHELVRGGDRAAWEQRIVDGLLAHDVELVVLAGFMKVVSTDFLRHWPDRVVNTHPSLLPSFRGAHAVRDALARGVKVAGLTVHLVDEEVDHGPILAQRAVPVLPGDDVDTLQQRIKTEEHTLFPAVVRALARGEVTLDGHHAHLDLDLAGPS